MAAMAQLPGDDQLLQLLRRCGHVLEPLPKRNHSEPVGLKLRAVPRIDGDLSDLEQRTKLIDPGV